MYRHYSYYLRLNKVCYTSKFTDLAEYQIILRIKIWVVHSLPTSSPPPIHIIYLSPVILILCNFCSIHVHNTLSARKVFRRKDYRSKRSRHNFAKIANFSFFHEIPTKVWRNSHILLVRYFQRFERYFQF